jgi:hypothetical protein
MENYLVNCQLYQERQGDYNLRKEINNLFQPTPNQAFPSGFNGNVHSQFRINQLGECSFDRNNHPLFLYESIPAALLLYRTICTFPPITLHVNGNDGYKVPWHYSLLHLPSNEIVVLDEWKGAAGFHTRFFQYQDMPQSLQNDLIKLFNYLLSNKCAHPYDGCTAGMVA